MSVGLREYLGITEEEIAFVTANRDLGPVRTLVTCVDLYNAHPDPIALGLAKGALEDMRLLRFSLKQREGQG